MATPQSLQATAMTSLSVLADPPQKHIDGAAMDYFLIEMVNTLKTSSASATTRAKKLEQEMIEAGLVPPPAAVPPPLPLKKESARDSVTSLASKSGSATGKAASDEDEEAVRVRLESIGMHVGANIAEKLCRDRGMFADTLDVIKFICKDIWVVFWDKQVDNLRTNHRGIYVLQDNQFKPVTRLSSWEGRPEAIRRAKLYAAMPAGIIKGALARLGYNGTVTPEITSLPQCTFQIKLPKNP
ncbi:Trafficking protein particle complex subunit 6B [Leucoagaricus sp. SymC.cos]|nr:Trafficking protein particle complex subunit 6B [Leucoagaricus sp. SymC.cos]